MLSWRCLLWIAFLLCGPSAAWAQDQIAETAYWTDTTGKASFEQAQLAQYTPYKGVLSKGFSQDVQWVRLKINPAPSSGSSGSAVLKASTDKLVLRIRPVFLDNITLYDPLDLSQGKSTRTTGDRSPLASTEFESLHHAFVIPTHDAPRHVWLRLSTSSTQLMYVEALTLRDTLREEHGLWLAYSALLAVLFSCLLWVFISWLQDRDQVNGAFVLRQTILLVYTACYLGYHRILLDGILSAQQQDSFYSWTLLFSTMLTFIFEYRLLQEYAISRWGRYALRAELSAALLAMLLMLMGRSDLALPLNTILVGVGILSIFVIALFIRTSAPTEALSSGRYLLPKRVLVAYYGFALALLAVSIMPSLALIQGTQISIYGILLYGLLSGLVMTSLLIVRSRQMERLRREQANHLFLSREQLALETRRRQDQSQLINMLMHELKTPLAVIELALKDYAVNGKAQKYVGRAIDNMRSILNRSVQTDRLVDRPFEIKTQHFDLSMQIQQWVHDIPQAEGRAACQLVTAAYVQTDLQCMQIITGNLIENALKYGDLQQPVDVTLHKKCHVDGREGLCLQVSNALGVTGQPDADKVFTKYYRSTLAQRQSGTGLGLFLAHNLAQQIGAELRYQPTPTHICFELWLPT
jgi:two-component system, sensor histidine kinase LadS